MKDITINLNANEASGEAYWRKRCDTVEAELTRLRAENERLRGALRGLLKDYVQHDANAYCSIGIEDELVNVASSVLSHTELAKPETCVDVEKIDTAIAEALGEACDCTRVWESWGYGAMRSDDFVRVSDDPGRIMEIRDAVLKAMGTPEQEAAPETCVWTYDSAGMWDTSCGNGIFGLEPMTKCTFCGKRVEVKE